MAARADILALDLHVDVTCLRAELAREGNLPLQEVGKALPAFRHRVELVLPDGRRVGVRELVGQRVDEQIGRGRRHEILLLALGLHELAADEVVDDCRARRLCTDAVDILELLLRFGILDILVDFLHAGQKRRGREARRRLRHLLEHAAALPGHVILLLHGRQCLGVVFFVFLFVLLIGLLLLFLRLVHDLPAEVALRAATGRERLLFIADLDLRLVVGVDGIELREVTARDEVVEIALLLRHLRDIGLHRRRDDGVVRRDLLVVPGAALLLGIGRLHPRGNLRVAGLREMREDGARIAELVRRQVLAV